jgi:hypothetical protein
LSQLIAVVIVNPPTRMKIPALATPMAQWRSTSLPIIACSMLGPARVPSPLTVFSEPTFKASISALHRSATTTGKKLMKPDPEIPVYVEKSIKRIMEHYQS